MCQEPAHAYIPAPPSPHPSGGVEPRLRESEVDYDLSYWDKVKAVKVSHYKVSHYNGIVNAFLYLWWNYILYFLTAWIAINDIASIIIKLCQFIIEGPR